MFDYHLVTKRSIQKKILKSNKRSDEKVSFLEILEI